MPDDNLREVRSRLDKASAALLDQCSEVLANAGVLDILLDRLTALAADGLHREERLGSDGKPIMVYSLSPQAELLLREYLWIATRPHLLRVAKQEAMIRVAALAGFAEHDDTTDSQ